MNKKILIIDDEADINRLIKDTLRFEGYVVESALTLKEGEEAFGKFSPDLILLDRKLPDGEGLDFCRKLKEDTRTSFIPVIMLTSRSSEADKIKGLDTGADDYVTKPFSAGELLARVKAILRRSGKKEGALEEQMAKLQRYIPKHMVEKILSTSGTIEGERRNVTVLLADISGFTSLAEQLDPEEVSMLVNDCFKQLVDIIYKYEGTVDKFIGDAVMAIFGVPIAHGNDPERAIRTGLEMQKKVGEFSAQKKYSLKLTIGINTGIVVVGTVGSDLRMDYTVMGDTVNLTSRLQTAAAPGDIFVSDHTEKQCRREIEFKKLEPLLVKGKKEPVHAYQVIGVRERKFGEFIRIRRIPLINREKEWGDLERACRKLLQGEGSVVSLVGEPGIGKTRLIEELLNWFSGKDVHIFGGIASAYEQGEPFSIFKKMLPRFLLPGETSIRNLFYSQAREAPVCLIMENIQWLDSASGDFLEKEIGEFPKSPVLAVFTYRTEFKPAWRGRFTEILLEEFSDEDVKKMAKMILKEKDVPPSVLSLVVEKSERNPLFVEEMIGYLVDEGFLKEKEKAWQIERPLKEAELSPFIQNIVMASLDRLGEKQKRILQYASCVGLEFKQEDLEIFWEDTDELKKQISRLLLKKVIFQVGENKYRFRHPLTKEILLSSLLQARRKEIEEKLKGLHF